MENDQSRQEVNSNYIKIKKNKMNKKKIEVRTFNDKNLSTGLYHCQLCSERAPTIMKLVEHCQEEHAGETYHCLEEGCQFKTENYCSLRIHYYSKTRKPVKTKNRKFTTISSRISLEIVEENDVDQSIKKRVKGFACPYDSCKFVTEVQDFDLDHEEALASLNQHEEEVHRTPREQLCYQLLFHPLSEEEIEEEDDDLSSELGEGKEDV